MGYRYIHVLVLVWPLSIWAWIRLWRHLKTDFKVNTFLMMTLEILMEQILHQLIYWYGRFSIVYRVLYIPGGCLGVLPSTVFPRVYHLPQTFSLTWWRQTKLAHVGVVYYNDSRANQIQEQICVNWENLGFLGKIILMSEGLVWECTVFFSIWLMTLH